MLTSVFELKTTTKQNNPPIGVSRYYDGRLRVTCFDQLTVNHKGINTLALCIAVLALLQ